jgi:hypothetical protein
LGGSVVPTITAVKRVLMLLNLALGEAGLRVQSWPGFKDTLLISSNGEQHERNFDAEWELMQQRGQAE